MTKYIVSGYIGFDNFGDEAIAHVLVNKLKSENASKITLISSNPEKTKKIHDVDSCGMFNFMLPLLKSDVLISGGGSLLQDVTSLKSLIYYLLVIFLALMMRKKVAIYAQGIGPINSKIGIFLTKVIFRYCKEISVRDVKSLALLESWGINATLVPDPILTIELPHKNKTGSVGIQLRSFKDLSDSFLELLANTVLENFKNKTINIISLQDELDLDVCEQFAKKLSNLGITNYKILSKLSMKDVFNEISDLELLIAMRFHACVVAVKSGVKVYVINYDPKVKSLAEEYNLPLIELDDNNIKL